MAFSRGRFAQEERGGKRPLERISCPVIGREGRFLYDSYPPEHIYPAVERGRKVGLQQRSSRALGRPFMVNGTVLFLLEGGGGSWQGGRVWFSIGRPEVNAEFSWKNQGEWLVRRDRGSFVYQGYFY